MNMHIWNATKQLHELAPPTCVLLLSKNLDPSPFFNIAPSLSMSNFYFSSWYTFSNFSPFVINFHKRYAAYWYKGLHWDRSLILESCIFYGHYQICCNDTTCSPWETLCRIFDLDTNWWGTSPYVIAWVIHLIILSSCMWGNFLHWWSLKVEDHL
jgi:hypothetical protein